MPSSFVDGEVAQATATSVTPSEPTGAAQNDIFVAILTVGWNSTIADPSGWTTEHTRALNGQFNALSAWIQRGASAPDLTFTSSASKYMDCVVGAFRGIDTSSPLDSVSASGGASTSGADHPDPPVTTAVGSNTMAVCLGTNWLGITGDPSGYTRVIPSGEDTCMVWYKNLSSSGNEDPGACTVASSIYWDGGTLTFLDASGGATGEAIKARFMILGVS